MYGFMSSEQDRFGLKILSIEKASGFAGRGDGCVGKGSSGKGILKKGRNKNGFGIGIGVGNKDGGRGQHGGHESCDFVRVIIV